MDHISAVDSSPGNFRMTALSRYTFREPIVAPRHLRSLHLSPLVMDTSRAPPGHFTVLYFASASSYVGKSSGGHDFFEAPMLATALFEMLDKKYPGIKIKVLDTCLLNLDDEYIDLEEESKKGEDGIRIQEGSTAVIIPPVSAG